MNEARSTEDILDKNLPVIDSHHHLFDKIPDSMAEHLKYHKFLIDEYVAYSGHDHNVVGTVLVEARSMYRADGPKHLRVVGETEFLNGQAAMAASDLYGKCRVGSGIVGIADLRIGDGVREVLEAHIAAAPGRFKGVRQEALWDADPSVLGPLAQGSEPEIYLDDRFRTGFKQLAPLGLSFDAFVLEPQLADILSLATIAPETQIILDHLGNPVGVGAYTGTLAERFPIWREKMIEISRFPNIVVKMGGIGSFLSGSPTYRSSPPATVDMLVDEWRPYVETAVEFFGADRCMFESNAPTDGSGNFSTVCNAYKTILAGCSVEEKRDIFARTAARVYRLDIPEGNSYPGEH